MGHWQFIAAYNTAERIELDGLNLAILAWAKPNKEDITGPTGSRRTNDHRGSLTLGKMALSTWLDGSSRDNSQWHGLHSEIIEWNDDTIEDQLSPNQSWFQSPTAVHSLFNNGSQSPAVSASPTFHSSSEENTRYISRSWSWKRAARRRSLRTEEVNQPRGIDRDEERIFEEGQSLASHQDFHRPKKRARASSSLKCETILMELQRNWKER